MKTKTKKPAKSPKAKVQWKVEHQFSYGWDDAGWTISDVKNPSKSEPMRFNSKKEAEAEINDFIKDQNEAFKRGDMDSKYSRSDYRAVPA